MQEPQSDFALNVFVVEMF